MSLGPQVLAALTAAAQPDQAQRQQGEQQLLHLKTAGGGVGSFLGACAEIFVSPQCPLMGRQLAGLQLKNAIVAAVNPNGGANTSATAQFFQSSAHLQTAICGQALVDAQRSVRNVAASIVSTAVYANLWAPEQTLQTLVQEVIAKHTAAGATGCAAVQGGMRALSQVASDCVLLLEERNLVGPVVQAVLPLVTSNAFFSPEFLQAAPTSAALVAVKEKNRDAVEIRSAALDVLLTFLDRTMDTPECASFAALRQCIGPVMSALLENVEALKVSRFLYHGFATKAVNCLVLGLAFADAIDDAAFQRVLQSMFEVTAYEEPAGAPAASPYLSENEREKLKIEATGFWGSLINIPRFAQQIEPALESLIYYLVRQMKYSDFEMGMLCANSNDWSVPDKIDDVRPRHYQGKAQQSAATSASRKANAPGGEGEEGSGVQNLNDDDEDDEDDDEEVREWNLRRVSAHTLDTLAEHYGEKVAVLVLKNIEGMMQPGQPWKDLEAAVLAFGAICDGCYDALRPYLPMVSARFTDLLTAEDTHFLVVNITLWACTQIGRYFIEDDGSAEAARARQDFQRLMRVILSKMQTPSKLTQESASEALETMVELCGDEGEEAVARLEPLAAEIIGTIATCLRNYQLKNKVLLFEVLETVCGVMGESLRTNGAVVETLLAPLGEMWGAVPNDNPLVFSYFTCMGTVCDALGPAVQPMAQQVFDRAYGLMSYHVQLRSAAYSRLHQHGQAATGGAVTSKGTASITLFDDVPEEDYLVTATDLLSGLFAALGSSLEPLLTARQPAFTQVVLFMLTDEESHSVRQSGFALLGDVCKACPAHVQTALPSLMEAVRVNLAEGFTETNFRVTSNIAWLMCNLLDSQLEINNLPTLASVAPTAMAQLFHGLAAVLCTPDLPKEASNACENIVLCLGMLLTADPELESKSQVPVSAYAGIACTTLLKTRDTPHKSTALQGFLLCVQSSPHGVQTVLTNLTLFFDLAVSMKHDGADLQRAIKHILDKAKQANAQLWQQKVGRYPRGSKTQLYQIYGIN